MSIKIICIDLDGTLFAGRNNFITEESIQAIQEASKRGIEVVITTGRIYNNAVQISEKLGVKSPVIAANGAIIMDRDLKKEIYYGALSKAQCTRLMEIAKKHKITTHFYTNDRVISNNLKGYVGALIYKFSNKHSKYGIKVDSCISYNTLVKRFNEYENKIAKCVIYSNNTKRVQAFKAEASRYEELTVCGAGKYSIEVNSKEVSKGKAVEILASYLGVEREEILCIGDNENDIFMIQYAGIGVAMGNAVPRLKEVSDYITDTNYNDGVAKAIRKFALDNNAIKGHLG
jgi:Cof subfamily protein (haloacid dehalogenase superfamily)